MTILSSQTEQAIATPLPHGPGAFLPPTPFGWRLGIVVAILALGITAYELQDWIGVRGQAAAGVVCFFGVAAVFSSNLRAINWRTIGWGFALQVLLVVSVIKLEVFGVRPVYEVFRVLGEVFKKFLQFSSEGAHFVFGKFADNEVGIFAFSVLPTIIFVASFFTVLYYFGVLQWIVYLMAQAMRFLLRTSGAETLSVSANVFMGQTEAPLIVKPYVPGMTQSELLALMVGGMAHISGSLLAVYIGKGADAVAILATSVMAAPCSLYLAKVVLPEQGVPETRGGVRPTLEREHANFIDAAAAGASDGLRLALNVAAMLVAFIAFIALANYLLGLAFPGLTLQVIFSRVFAPVAFLMGVPNGDIPHVADLLGTKLVLNEFVAYSNLTSAPLSPRGLILATYALTGFANFSSIGIQIGGIGSIAPTRRSDLARLGPRALLTGFLVTLINASIAGILLDVD
jgi:CNT family concentrative nucleoside transporter